jgi:hypothetical protein
VQLDASPFAWFEVRGSHTTLHGLTTTLTVLGQTCRTFGCPVTLYGDRASVFQRNDRHWSREEQLRGAQDPTHFGCVLQDLGTGFIAAQSPQAKGRIERLWGTLQDRLVSELRTRDRYSRCGQRLSPGFSRGLRASLPAGGGGSHARLAPAPRDLERVTSRSAHLGRMPLAVEEDVAL